jgi:hypothetical protein
MVLTESAAEEAPSRAVRQNADAGRDVVSMVSIMTVESVAADGGSRIALLA